MAPFRIRHGAIPFVSLSPRPLARFRLHGVFRLPFGSGRNTLNLFASFSGLHPAAESSQSLPAGVTRTHFAGAILAIAVLTTAWAKSFAVRLAQRSDRQGQKHLLAQHILKQKTVLLIITDFRLRRSYGPLRGLGIRHRRPEDQVEIRLQRNLHRFNASSAGNLKSARKMPPQPDVGHDVLGPAMLVQYLGQSGGG